MQQSCSHYNAFCSITWHTRMHLRTWKQNITTIMQPLHRDLQPQVPKRLIPMHTGTTAQCKTPCRHQQHVQGTPAATASAAAATLPEKHSILRSGFRPNTSPHVAPCNSHVAITMRFAASHGIPACIYAHGKKTSQQSYLQPQVPNRSLPTHTRTAAQCRTACRNQQHVQGTPAATASAAAATLPEKHSILRSGFRPNTSPHVAPCNSHVAITMRFAASHGIPACIYAHGKKTSQQSYLQPQVPNRSLPTHTRTAAQCRTACRNQSHVQGTPAATASAAAATLPEKHSVSRSGFRPNTSPHVVPCNSHAAITLRFAASRGIPACISAHGNKPSQQSCSHYIAICNHRFQNALYLRTHEQPHSAEHPVDTNHTSKGPQPQPPHRRAALHWRLQPPYAKNKVFRAQASSPTRPM